MSNADRGVDAQRPVSRGTDRTEIDALVIGAGMGGLYALRTFLKEGLSVLGAEAATDVGGVWLHNSYPGARVDIEGYYYCFFDPEIYPSWRWRDRYPSQPELLAYLRHYASHYDLHRHIRFNTRIVQMRWDANRRHWLVRANDGSVIEARHVLLATGQLSQSRALPFRGVDTYRGEWVETAHWPNSPVGLDGRRVAVIGTGSSGVQTITEVAKVASHLQVFQRTANFVVPSQNAPIDQRRYERFGRQLDQVWQQVMGTAAGYIAPYGEVPASDLSSGAQRARMEEQWSFGGLSMTRCFPDQRTSVSTNRIVSNFVRAKVRQEVEDSRLADLLEPRDYPIGTRRLAVCDGYYSTFNRDNVTLVDLRSEAIVEVTSAGIRTTERDYEFDTIISALGFDAFTGAVDAIDIRNDEGASPRASWSRGPNCYLGLMLHSFPNLYFLTGPGSPSVLVNFNAHNVVHVDFVLRLMRFAREHGADTVEPTEKEQEAYREVVSMAAEGLLRNQVENYMSHLNDDGSRFFIPFAGGWSAYVDILSGIEEDGYRGFTFC